MQCSTSWLTRGNCTNLVTKCVGCGDTFCSYHQPGVQPSRWMGGHVCPNPCTIQDSTKVEACKGYLAPCAFCGANYCQAHMPLGEHSCSHQEAEKKVAEVCEFDLMSLSFEGPFHASCGMQGCEQFDADPTLKPSNILLFCSSFSTR